MRSWEYWSMRVANKPGAPVAAKAKAKPAAKKAVKNVSGKKKRR
jgi:hypothetical protein